MLCLSLKKGVYIESEDFTARFLQARSFGGDKA